MLAKLAPFPPRRDLDPHHPQAPQQHHRRGGFVQITDDGQAVRDIEPGWRRRTWQSLLPPALGLHGRSWRSRLASCVCCPCSYSAITAGGSGSTDLFFGEEGGDRNLLQNPGFETADAVQGVQVVMALCLSRQVWSPGPPHPLQPRPGRGIVEGRLCG